LPRAGLSPTEERVMPECQNCGSFVTQDYVRVFTPDGIDAPRVCPRCEDKIRDGADVREARSPRHT
jgi:NAD-dependent SIR2 family protein deacetylase